MEFNHEPVLLKEVIEGLRVKPDGIYVDGTLGGGGHGEEVVKRLGKEGAFLGIDRDRDAIEAASKRLDRDEYPCRKIFVHDNFTNIKKILSNLSIENIDGALLDLGVSSYQLDDPERGFSYMQEAPLDMRMDQEAGFTAYEVVNDYPEEELSALIRRYGEERYARRIAASIAAERKKAPIDTTEKLVDIIKGAIPARNRREGPHPAKRTFQAIRIEVNDELSPLERAVEDFTDVLKPDGRLAIITFHSLEDRIVKNVFKRRENPCTCPPGIPVCVCGKVPDVERITGKPVEASEEELAKNPRARSAKLRVIRKLDQKG